MWHPGKKSFFQVSHQFILKISAKISAVKILKQNSETLAYGKLSKYEV